VITSAWNGRGDCASFAPVLASRLVYPGKRISGYRASPLALFALFYHLLTSLKAESEVLRRQPIPNGRVGGDDENPLCESGEGANFRALGCRPVFRPAALVPRPLALPVRSRLRGLCKESSFCNRMRL
jgi:hypothetical protein